MLNATTEDMEPSYFIPVSFFGGGGGANCDYGACLTSCKNLHTSGNEGFFYQLCGCQVEKIIILIVLTEAARGRATTAMVLRRQCTHDIQHFYDCTSTIVILVIIMMLGQCMLPVIASDNGESNDYAWSDGVYSF